MDETALLEVGDCQGLNLGRGRGVENISIIKNS